MLMDPHILENGANGLIHGYGIYNYVNGDIYEGDFKEGKMHGWGYYKFNNGNEYHGQWADDK